MIAMLVLAFLAGVLSVLSPCVLPLLPIVLGTAASENKLGPIALAAGLAISFVAIGLFVATIGFAAGVDTGVFRAISAAILIAVGLVLLVPKLQAQFALAASRCGVHASGRRSARHRSSPPRARTSARSRSRCSCSGSAPLCQ
jgi:cytochrome c-type biogenesis protein